MESISDIADRLWMDRTCNGWDECLNLAINDHSFRLLMANELAIEVKTSQACKDDFSNLIKAMDICPTGGSVEIHKGGHTFNALRTLLNPETPELHQEAK